MPSTTHVDRDVTPGNAPDTSYTSSLIEAMHEAMPFGLVILDLDLRIQHINPSVTQEIGCSLEAAIGQSLQFLLGHGVTRPLQLARLALSSRQPQRLDHFSGDGVRFWVVRGLPLYRDGDLVGVGLTFVDATVRKRAEDEIRESEERYRALVESMPDAVLVHRNRRVVFANQAAADLLRFAARTDLLGRDIVDLVPIQERGNVAARVEQLERTGVEILSELQIGVDEHGRARWGEARSKLIRLEGGPAIQVIVRDITTRRRMNEMLEERVEHRTAELREANRDLESFSYTVSHDLRAPLRHISGHASMLLERKAVLEDPEAQRHAASLIKAAARLGHLVDDLLNFSRASRSALRRLPLEMSALVHDIRRELEEDSDGRRVSWLIHSLPEANCDPTLIKQVWQNLLGNAIKYSRKSSAAEIEVGAREDAVETVYYVKDNGVGFDPRYAEKLFGVFERLHSPQDFEGTGIGLAIAQRIIQRHGGRIWAQGEIGVGATFSFALPK